MLRLARRLSKTRARRWCLKTRLMLCKLRCRGLGGGLVMMMFMFFLRNKQNSAVLKIPYRRYVQFLSLTCSTPCTRQKAHNHTSALRMHMHADPTLYSKRGTY